MISSDIVCVGTLSQIDIHIENLTLVFCMAMNLSHIKTHLHPHWFGFMADQPLLVINAKPILYI